MKNILPWKRYKQPTFTGEIEKLEDASLFLHGVVKGAPILNNHYCQQKVHNLKNFRYASILITQWNWEAFSKIFGARSFQHQGDEFLYDVWVVTFADEIFKLYTSDQQVTTIEIVIDTDETIFIEDQELGKKCFAFWNKLAENIEEAIPEVVDKLKGFKKK